MKKIVALLLAAILTLSLGSVALADEIWAPGKTVFIDVGARAGGGTDLIIRYITQALGELNPGVNFVVNNYDVADVGLAKAAYADPDGLNLSVISVGNVTNYHFGSSNFDPDEIFTVVARVTAGGPQAYVATAGAPYSNFNELVDYIRTGDKKVKIGVNMGAISHLSWLSAFNAIDPELNNLVNYVQSGGEADKLTNIASGSIDLANCSMNNAIAYEADGKLVVLGIIGPEAATREATGALVGAELGEQYANLQEQGYDYSLDVGTYITLPIGTDPAIVEYVSNKLVELNGNETFENGMKTMGQFTEVLGLEETRAAWADEVEEFTGVMRDLNMMVVE
ncbi:MAG: hypothetical protein IJ157_01215 [Clostridia bacterium]|nr:hypothetical protein [Clostridia bacterium]